MVSNEVFRGRYRQGFDQPEPIAPRAVLEYSFSLHTQNYTFLKGHRLMVQVQSTWFPIIDRNPQTFVPNIFKATVGRFPRGDAADLPIGALSVARVSASRRIAAEPLIA